MNILYLCDEYPPAKTGGIGTVTKVVAEAMVQKGHTVYVLSGRPAGHALPYETSINGVIVYRLTYFKILLPLFKMPERYKNITINILRKVGAMHFFAKKAQRQNDRFAKSLIRSKNIEIIEKPDYSILSKYFIRPIRFIHYGIPTIIRVHGAPSFISYYKTGYIANVQRTNDINNYLSADRICAVSEFSKNFVQNILQVDKKIDVIYNPLENKYLQMACSTSRSNTIVFLGKIIETKGAFSLIKAFCSIASKYPNINLIMIGGGKIRAAQSFIDDQYRERIKFTGYLSREEIKQKISTALFCAIPSYFENFSLAAMEVMACGKALIYTNRASGPELINDKVNGLLVDPENVCQIASAIEFLLNNLEQCQQMGLEAQKTILHTFSENVVMEQIENYYKSCINSHRKNDTSSNNK